jgi:hypothetical protein
MFNITNGIHIMPHLILKIQKRTQNKFGTSQFIPVPCSFGIAGPSSGNCQIQTVIIIIKR